MIDNNKNINILIVDDVINNLKLLNEILSKEQYNVIAAKSGEEALYFIKNSKPDIILLDVIMTGISGFEVCEKLKSNEETAEIPVIFLSALTDTENKIKGFKVGGVDFITKPFHFKEVLIRVKTHLEISKLQSKLKQNLKDNIKLNEKLEKKNIDLHLAKTIAEESEAKYSVLINNTAFPIVVSSFEGKILFANEIANSFFDIKNVQEINITEFWNNPEQRDFFVSKIRKFGKVENFEAEVKRKNGDVYTLIVNSTLIVYNGELSIYNVYNDITQRKQAENLLKEKNEEYEALNEELQQTNKDLSFAKENIEKFTRKLIESEKALKIKLDYILSTIKLKI